VEEVEAEAELKDAAGRIPLQEVAEVIGLPQREVDPHQQVEEALPRQQDLVRAVEEVGLLYHRVSEEVAEEVGLLYHQVADEAEEAVVVVKAAVVVVKAEDEAEVGVMDEAAVVEAEDEVEAVVEAEAGEDHKEK